MKALIVASNREKSPFPVIPVGATIVAEICASNGIDVEFVDMCFSETPLDDLRDALDKNPDFVAISFRNLNNHDGTDPVSYVPFLKSISMIVRDRGIPLYIGGSAASIEPQEILDVTGANAVYAGQADGFVKRLVAGKPLEGVIIDDMGEPFVNVDLERWVDIKKYLTYERSVPIRLKLGCSYKCSYCTYPGLEGKSSHTGELGALELYLRKWIDRGVGIDIVDSIFNEPEEWAIRTLESLIEKGLEGSYHISAFSPRVSDSRILKAMTRIGANVGMIGIDSGSDTMLESYRKPFRMEKVNRFMEMRKDHDLRFLWTFILGGPCETEKTLDESLKFIDSLPDTDVAFIVFGVRVYRQTHLYKQAIKENAINKDDSLLKPIFYFSKSLDRYKAEQSISDWQENRDNVLTDNVSNSKGYLDTLQILSELEASKTGWENIPTIKRLMRRRAILRNKKVAARATI